MTNKIKIEKEDLKSIGIARKYRLRLGTMKFEIFRLFEEGYTPSEVRYIIRDHIVSHDGSKIKNINRYYYSWKKLNKSQRI